MNLAPERDVTYQVYPVAFPTPGVGGFRLSPDSDQYYRLEVFAVTGSMDYDVLGYTQDQLINDALDGMSDPWNSVESTMNTPEAPRLV